MSVMLGKKIGRPQCTNKELIKKKCFQNGNLTTPDEDMIKVVGTLEMIYRNCIEFFFYGVDVKSIILEKLRESEELEHKPVVHVIFFHLFHRTSNH